MRLPFVLLHVTALLLPSIATAQEKTTDLTPFEKAFREAVEHEPVIAIACVTGSPPLVLWGGSRGDDQPVDESSLIPVAGIAHILLGDALHVQRRGKLDGTALEIGDKKVTWQQLIQGSSLLPDYIAWNGTKDAPTLEDLVACAEIFQAAGQEPWNWQGLSDTLALAPELQGKAHANLPSALRATLAPYVPGLDPVDARTLPKDARRRVVHNTLDDVEVTRAEPAAARLVLPIKQVANWLQWRHASGAPLWSGPRSGRLGEAHGYDDVKRWELWSSGPARIRIFSYPDHGATLLLCDLGGDRELVSAFQRVLLGEPEVPESAFGVAELLEEAEDAGLDKLGKKAWQLEGRDETGSFRVDGKTFIFTYDGIVRRSQHWSGTAATGYMVSFEPDADKTGHRMALRLTESPRRLHAAWIERRSWRHVLPRHLIFAPSQDDDR